MENIKIHCPRGYQKQSIYNGNIADATLQSENKRTKTESSYVICLSHPHIHSLSKHLWGTQTYIHTLVTKRTSAYKPAVSHPAQSQMFNPDSAHLKLVS